MDGNWTFGLRGVVGENLFPEDALRIGRLFASFQKKNAVVLGCDVRTTSEMLKQAFTGGVVSTGTNVIDLGIVPTPVVQFACRFFKIHGAMITASHNPPEYNGIKLLGNKGIGLQTAELKKVLTAKEKPISWKNMGTVERRDVIPVYLNELRKRVDSDSIKSRKPFVLVDLCNSTMSRVIPKLLQELDCEFISVNADLNGMFPGRNPEPTPENLDRFSKMVKSSGVDFGIAYDSDGDRAVFVDEKGNVVPGDETFGLIVDDELRKHPGGTIVTTVATSSLVDDIARRYNGKVVRTRVGDPVVAKTLLRVKGILGGEENGGVIHPDFVLGRDGALTTAKILELFSKEDKKFSSMLRKIPKYHRLKTKVAVKNTDKVIDAIKKIVEEEGFNVDTTDGVKILFKDGWVLIRASGTEPVIRLFSEARTKGRMRKYLELGRNLLERATLD